MFALSAFGLHGHLLRANLYITYCFEQGKPGEGHLEPGQLGEGNSEGAHGARHGRGDDNDDLFFFNVIMIMLNLMVAVPLNISAWFSWFNT